MSSDFTTTNACSGGVSAKGTCTITVTFVPTCPGQRSETITLTDNAPNSPQIINVIGSANPIAISLTPQTSAIGTGQNLQFSATGDPAGVTWSLAGFTNTGLGTAAPPGTIDSSGNYTPPPGSPSLYVMVTATSKTDPTKSSTATVNVVAPGMFRAPITSRSRNTRSPRRLLPILASSLASIPAYGFTTWTLPTGGQFGGAPVSPYTSPA